jgi:hypothetical protein
MGASAASHHGGECQMTKFACTERSRNEFTKGECCWVSAVALWVSMAGMKRAGRIVLNGLTGLSLILAVLVAVMWVRSQWRSDAVWTSTRAGLTRPRAIFLSNGLAISAVHWVTPAPISMASYRSGLPLHGSWDHSCLGVGWEKKSSPIASWTMIAIPYAYLLALFSLLPAIRLFHWVRRRGLNRPGHCATCGYDLRATPDRCPECGTLAAAPPSTLGPSTAAGA